MNRILVATDGSAPAGRAVRFAAALSGRYGAQLVILAVSEGLSAGEDLERFAKLEHATVGDLLEAEAQGILTNARQLAKEAAAVEAEALVGDPATVILDSAKTRKVDVIVVGKRGRGRLEGLLMGSVSQKLVSLAPCPIVIVP